MFMGVLVNCMVLTGCNAVRRVASFSDAMGGAKANVLLLV